MGRRSASSLPGETGRAPVASVNRANSLSGGFVGFLCKPRNISLFLSSIFLSTTFFPYLSLNQSLTPSPLRITLYPPGLDPGKYPILIGHTVICKEMATHSTVFAWRIPGTWSLVGCRLWSHTESDTTEAT